MSDYPVLVSIRYHHQYHLKSCKISERLQTVCNERKFIYHYRSEIVCVYPCSGNGKLKMILKCGCVEVTFVRQMKRQDIIPEVGHHVGIDFYELKETNTDTLRLVEGRLVELEHNDNQEIEVLQYYSAHAYSHIKTIV